MDKIEKYEAEIDELQKQIDALEKKKDKIINKIRIEEEKKLQAKLAEIKVGDKLIKNEGITQYHCTVLTVYEILDIHQDEHYRPLIVRQYRINYADGDFYTTISAERLFVSDISDYEKLEDAEFTDLLRYFLTPQLYENSTKWDVTNNKRGNK